VPLFSLRGGLDWGIGEIGHVPRFARWLAAAGHRLLQLLPIWELVPGERSPYAPLSAFAIDPIYISLADVEDFAAAGGEAALPSPQREVLDRIRGGRAIDYDAVRILKQQALEIAFNHFSTTEWPGGSARGKSLGRFREAEAPWLADYSLFRACRRWAGEQRWQGWAPALRDRQAQALETTRAALGREILFHEYVQWLAAEQWDSARRAAAAAGVALKGDLPFMIAGDSADVWARQAEFALDASLGAPPDAFHPAGQDWGLPFCRWEVMAAGDFAWWRQRAARAAELFDTFRLDHVVGFYRMYTIPPAGRPAFVPRTTDAQRKQGRRILALIREAGTPAEAVGEDLGTVPAFVRTSLARLRIPGYRVLRWEREGGRFRDPRTYPRCSVATGGTHDTSTLAAWWAEELDAGDRRALAAVPPFRALDGLGDELTPAVRDALLDGLYAAGSELVVILFQDSYGGRERVNVPATLGAGNWAYRLPWTLEELACGAGAALAEGLRRLARRHGR
jgi:4-alpha-glucanotransferase